ncbi:MAG: ATP-binding protein [Pseudomonadota bacterium]
MFNRKYFIDKIELQFNVHRIVALLGPRQSGKTTVAKQYCQLIQNFNRANYFDLENPADLERLNNPILAFEYLNGMIVIDEVQRKPDLFQVLRYIHDQFPEKKFLLLGSASRDLINKSSESLAGRIGYIEITPFLGCELEESSNYNLWLRGGYPRSYLATNNKESYVWRREYIRTYIEQDIPNLLEGINIGNLRKFWMMIANYHGQTFNASEISNNLGIARTTVQKYLEILASTFMIRILEPWYENIGKRQVKSPKIYIRDSGIFHYLLGIQDIDSLLISQKLGASWEGFALEQIISFLEIDRYDSFFWTTHAKAELDLLILKNGKKLGFEFKYSDAPKLTPSMKIAIEDLKLDQLRVIYPGKISYNLDKNIKVISLNEFIHMDNNNL